MDRGHVERALERPHPAGLCWLEILSYLLKSDKAQLLCALLFCLEHARGGRREVKKHEV